MIGGHVEPKAARTKTDMRLTGRGYCITFTSGVTFTKHVRQHPKAGKSHTARWNRRSRLVRAHVHWEGLRPSILVLGGALLKGSCAFHMQVAPRGMVSVHVPYAGWGGVHTKARTQVIAMSSLAFDVNW